ncbi:MAG: putative phiE125 gp8 family phage protein [Candidatus Midichloriaceae bacterium]|jgi:uncharacterized phiE125 gp8 family phage protein
MQLLSLKNLGNAMHLPIDIEVVKTYLKIDNSVEDDLLKTMILSAANQCEEYAGVSLVIREWSALFKCVSSKYEIILPKSPVENIVSIYGRYSDEKEYELNKKLYYLLDNRIILKQACSFTTIKVNFEAGYREKLIPCELKTSILEHVADMYENRNCCKSILRERYKKFRGIRI